MPSINHKLRRDFKQFPFLRRRSCSPISLPLLGRCVALAPIFWKHRPGKRHQGVFAVAWSYGCVASAALEFLGGIRA